MDDEITQSSPSEEPTPTEVPAVAKPSDDEMPTVARSRWAEPTPASN